MTQSPNRNQLVLIAITLLIAIALVLITWLSPRQFVIWNASKSVPIGWYLVENRAPKIHSKGKRKRRATPATWLNLIDPK